MKDDTKELTFEEFVDRLIEAGWEPDKAKEEANRNFDGYYDEDDGS